MLLLAWLAAISFGVVVALTAGPQQQKQQHAHQHLPYAVSTPVHIECRAQDGSWGPGPICSETKESLTLRFGVDMGYRCTLAMDDALYAYLRQLISVHSGWNCRVAMSADDHSFKIPFAIPLWGLSETQHIHIDNHVNFVFHADSGWIIGAAAYPMRERFEETTPSSQLSLHGEIRWFRQHTFEPLVPRQGDLGGGGTTFATSMFVQVFMLTLLAASLVFFVFVMAYMCVLRPRIIARLNQQKQALAAATAAAPAPPQVS